MTPTERIQRLREETVPERWTIYNDMVCAEVDGCTCGAGHDTFPHEPGCGLDHPVATVEHAEDRQHIARWDPQAAARALDLLALLFDKHFESLNYDGDQQPLGICDREPVGWPCATYTAALALLDTIDPEGAA